MWIQGFVRKDQTECIYVALFDANLEVGPAMDQALKIIGGHCIGAIKSVKLQSYKYPLQLCDRFIN
jgi:hypothetical protein